MARSMGDLSHPNDPSGAAAAPPTLFLTGAWRQEEGETLRAGRAKPLHIAQTSRGIFICVVTYNHLKFMGSIREV